MDHNEPDNQSLAILMCISMSDYSFWSNQRLLEIASENDGCEWLLPHLIDASNQAYKVIPILQVLHMSRVFEYLPSLPLETIIVGAIRKSASEFLEARMIVSPPSHNPWSTVSQPVEKSSGYEVRRRGWNPYKRNQISKVSQAYWDDRTVYVVSSHYIQLDDSRVKSFQENLPRNVRSHTQIYSFLLGITSQEKLSSIPLVESVSFPPHHDDEHSSILPRCKGFAFIVFSHTEDAEELQHRWPWEGSLSTEEALENAESRAAKESGFRSLSKSRWEDLKYEYLAYQRSLLDTLLEEDDACSYEITVDDSEPPPPRHIHSQVEVEQYPKDCLVFVRNLHSGTNKTSLRSLFSLAFANAEVDAIDYVDFNRGMDTVSGPFIKTSNLCNHSSVY